MKQWYVLQSKSRQEGFGAPLLTIAGIETYLALRKAHRIQGRPPAPEPFFPGYFFARLDSDRGEVRLAAYTAGIVRIVGYGGNPWPISDNLIQTFYARHADCLMIYQLPVYSPDLIRIEHLWKKARKEDTHLRSFPTLAALVAKVTETLTTFARSPHELTAQAGEYRELTALAG